MRRDLTTDRPARTIAARRPLPVPIAWLARLLAAMALAPLALALASQVPVTHIVDIGGYDSAYVQGFYDPERADSSGDRPYLDGSDGAARWTRDVSYLLFPQAGLPAQVTLRLRGWRASGPAPHVVVLLNGARELGRFRAATGWEEYTFAIDSGLLKPNDVVVEIRSETASLRADDPRPVGVLLDRAIYRAGPAPITPYPAQLLYGALGAGMLYILLSGRPATNDGRQGDKETRGQGDKGTRRQGDKETRGQGDKEALRTAEPQSSVLSPQSWAPTSDELHAQNSKLKTQNSDDPRPPTPDPRPPTPVSWLWLRPWSPWLAGLLALTALWLALYRMQPPYPYPLRGLLPAIDAVLVALLALRFGPALARRAPALLDALAIGGACVWAARVLFAARDHVTLSVPGVEKDFRVFATRSDDLAGVFRADGFYNLGYPLLLWLARPLAQGNAFLAGRLLAALSGALLLGATWWLARRLLGRGPALLALLALALSPLVVEYALYLGTDMPFAALCALALALLVAYSDDRRTTDPRPPTPDPRRAVIARHARLVVLAGFAAGMAFLVRHPGLLLLPFGWLAIWMTRAGNREPAHGDGEMGRRGDEETPITHHAARNTQHVTRTTLLLFTLAFLLTIAPQIAVNVAQTGQPLYNQQAKNIWLAVFGDGDWGRWGETSDSVTLRQVVLQDPGRFLANWWGNLRGYVGAGGEDTTEFGHAIQLRLLGFPANWLAIMGMLGWLVLTVWLARHSDTVTRRQGDTVTRRSIGPYPPAHPLTRSPAHPLTRSPAHPLIWMLLLAWVVLYVLAVNIGIALPRFFLPLTPVYALAAAWTVSRLRPTIDDRPPTTDDRRPATDDQRPAADHRGTGQQASGSTHHVSRTRFYVLRFTFYVLRNPPLAAGLLCAFLLWNGFAAGAGYVLGNQPADEVAAVRLVQATLRPGDRVVVRVPERVSLGKYSAITHLAAPAPAADDPRTLRATGVRYLLWSSALGPAPAVGEVAGATGQYTLYRMAP